MKTSLGIWAFGGMATRCNPAGYQPELAGVATAADVGIAVLHAARHNRDAVRAYELVYAALGA